MLNLHLQPSTEAQLKKVLSLYRDDEQFAQQMIAYQTAELNKALLGLRLDLQAFEQCYQMPSVQFYRRFQAGDLDDREDFMVWAGSYELARKNEARLSELSHAA